MGETLGIWKLPIDFPVAKCMRKLTGRPPLLFILWLKDDDLVFASDLILENAGHTEIALKDGIEMTFVELSDVKYWAYMDDLKRMLFY